MSHEWHRGILDASSWHGLEEVGTMADAGEMRAKARAAGAWATKIDNVPLYTAEGLAAPARGIVAHYENHPSACLSSVGGRFRAMTPAEWDSLVDAAYHAGARPTGALSLRYGTRPIATFEVGLANGIRTQFVLADAYDGTLLTCAGFSSIRVVCANTFSACMSADGHNMAKLRHTASLESKVAIMAEAIGAAIASGDKVRDSYHRAEALYLDRAQAESIFDRLFPPAPEGAAKVMVSRADRERSEARQAMARAENNAGGTLATIWNAATWLVDRTVSGTARPTRGGDALDSLLFGTRNERVAEVQTIIEVILRDGKTVAVPAGEALAMGADPRQVGRSVLDEMLAELS